MSELKTNKEKLKAEVLKRETRLEYIKSRHMSMFDEEIEGIGKRLDDLSGLLHAHTLKADLEALQYKYCSVKFLIEELEEDVSGQTSADQLVEGWNNCREYIQKRFKEIQ